MLISIDSLKTVLNGLLVKINKKPDWSQNDPSADNYVKNRTHWEETNSVILLPEVAFEHDGSEPFCPLTPISPFVVGKEYVVTYDNVKYSCVAYPSSDNGVAVGNGSLFIFGENEKDGNGEPFFFVNYHDDNDEDFSAIFPAEEGAHTMSIKGESIAVHKIDPKYLPDDISVQADWNQDDSNAKDFVKNRPFYEGNEILFEGDLTVNQYGSASFGTGLSVNAGQEYTVIVDGMSMTGTARYTETEYTIGNGYYDEDGNRIFGADNYGIYIADDYYPEGTVIHVTVSTYDVKQIDEKFVKWAMRNEDPVGTGSFSMNRKKNTTIGYYSHAEGDYTTASGSVSHAEGSSTEASGNYSHAEGSYTKAIGKASHAEGSNAEASGDSSHAEGYNTTASGDSSHAEGYKTTTQRGAAVTILDASENANAYSHAEGYGTVASGCVSHSEGNGTMASGSFSHAEGSRTTASGNSAHAEGRNNSATGTASHAEGQQTTASGDMAHAEGRSTTASSDYSHAEGSGTTASGDSSHAEGYSTKASGKYQHVQGKYNIEDTNSKYAHIVGNGDATATVVRSNAHTLDWYGVGWYKGGLQVGGNAQDDGAKKVLLEGDAIPVPETAEIGQIVAVKAIDEDGKPSEWEVVDMPDSVAYDEVQTLTDEQKAQARENIGAQETDFIVNVNDSDIADKTWYEVLEARNAERRVYIKYQGWLYDYVGEGYDYSIFVRFNGAEHEYVNLYDYTQTITTQTIRQPEKLPNPNALTFTGAVSTTYDGSKAVTVEIPDSGGNVDQSGSIFVGKTASFYGDSLTEINYHYTKGYHSWVKDLLGLASYSNYGVSGYKVSDVYNKVNSVTDTADIIFVMCGVNDQNYSVPLGTMGDNTTGTTYGALNLLCALLKEKYPTKLVVFITPHYQTKYPHSSGVTSYEVSKAIREVCEKYAIPVYDNYALSGMYSTNLSAFTTDNCHWNDVGHEMVGKNLARFMLNTFRYIHGGTGSGESHTHSYTEKVTTEATCTTAGVKTFICECGDKYTQSIPATGHSWNDGVVTVEPTETTQGVKTYTCTVCGETRTETIPALDHAHSYVSTVIAPTCTEQGYTEHVCACGDSYKDTYVNATGHTYVDDVCSMCGLSNPVDFIIINNSLSDVTYVPGALEFTFNTGRTFYGVVFEGATEVTLNLTGIRNCPWLGVRDGDVFHTHSRGSSGTVDSFDWSPTLSPTKMSSGGVALPDITTAKIEGGVVNFYNDATGELLVSHTGDAIVLITSNQNRPNPANITIM